MLRRTEVNFDPFRDGELFASVPSTEAQKEIWASIVAEPDANLCYNESIRVELKGELDQNFLCLSINELIRRRDSLRASFSPLGKRFLVASFSPQELPVLDLSAMSEEDAKKQLAQRAIGSTLEPFDLEKGPLFRFELIRLSSTRHLLFLSAHHLICDGWSLSLLVRDISRFYEAFALGAAPTDPLPAQFYKYALEARADQVSLDYWRNEFKSIPAPLDLEGPGKRPAFRTFDSERIDYEINRDVFKNARVYAGKNKNSVYQYLLAAFQTLLFKVSNNEDLVVGISLAGQASAQNQDLVGHLVHMLPIRCQLNDAMSFRDLLRQTKGKMLDAQEHQNATFGQILKELDIPRDPSRIPLINVVFNVDQQYPGQGFEFKNVVARYDSNPRFFENFEIFINATTLGDRCVLECQYNKNLFESSLIQAWLREFENILERFNQNLDSLMTSFSLPRRHTEVCEVKETQPVAQTQSVQSSPENLKMTREIWEEVLGMQGIPVDANFFSIGGHSLLAVDICHKVYERTGRKLVLKDLVLNPTIDKFSTLLPECEEEGGAVLKAKGLAKGLSEAPLTLSQFQAWYQEQLRQGTSMHNLPSAIRVNVDLDFERLKEAYKKLLVNYPSLRTSIQSGPLQKVEPAHVAFSNLGLELVDNLDLEEVVSQMQAMALEPYELSQAPLFRAKAYKLGPKDYVLFNCFHHMIFDGWSFDIFFQALTDAYEGKVLEREGSTFLDYAKWQELYLDSDEFKKDLAYWKKKLEGPLPVLELPTDFPRPASICPESSAFAFELDAQLGQKLRRFCENSGVSLFSVILGCFKKTLMDYSRCEELLVGIPVRGRNSSDQLNTIGYFVNAVAIRTRSHSGVLEFLKHTQEEVGEALARQNAPFEKVKESLGIPRDSSRTPVVQTFFSFQEVGNRKGEFAQAPYSQINLHKAAIHTDMDMWIKASKTKIEGAIEYRKDLFTDKSVQRLQHYFNDLLEFVASGGCELWEDFSSPSLFKAIAGVNATQAERPDKRMIPDYIDHMAQSDPSHLAVVAGDLELNYQQLSLLSDRMAYQLKRSGVKKGDLVGVSLDRDELLMVTLIGVMKAGAGYVPLDPFFPPERLDYMVGQSELTHLVTNNHYKSLFAKHPITVMGLEDFDLEQPETERVAVSPEQTAYVIYTSGSTGKPKGVDISFHTCMNFLHSMKKAPGFCAKNKLLAVTTLSFDISVLELFLPLVAGGTVYIAKKEETIDGDALLRTIQTKGIDVLQATPPTWRILLAAGWKGADNFKVLCGGEAFPRDLAESLIPICGEVWNMYGPTEATVWATCKKLESHKGVILVGRPLENYTAYILDEQLRPVPFGAVGELYIGGEGPAKGYYKRPELTSERFLPDPVRGEGVIYKTGDLARFHVSGEIECLGRNDDQVKIRGYRIELGEVEAALAEIDEIAQAVAMAREDRPGDVRLVAYMIAKDGKPIDQFKLREKLARKLPPYMIPANYIQMEQFPLTLTGKVERKTLPPIDFDKCAEEFVGARRSGGDDVELDELETKFAGIWMSTIGVEDYDLEDNFFEVGGNSLLSVGLFSRISKELNVELPLATLISHSRFGEILELVRVNGSGLEAPLQSIPKRLEKTSQGHASEVILEVPQICSSVVVIKKSGDKTPVFCFHGVGGNVLNYLKLAPAFKERPLFGVQSQGVDGKSQPLRTIQEMASKYMEEIRLVQPYGPYILAGGSMGGLVALETAKLLQEAGEKVESVIMLDTFGPDADFTGYRSQGSYWKSLIFSLKWRVRKQLVRAQSALLKVLGLPIPHEIRHFRIEVLNYEAIWSHTPNIYGGDIDLIRAPLADNGWYRQKDMGWGKVVKGEIRTHIVEGRHEDFVEAPGLPKALENVLASY